MEKVASKLLLGRAKKEITYLVPGMTMLGWGKAGNYMDSVESPLFCRAFVIKSEDNINSSQKILAWILVDLCFVTQALHLGVYQKLVTLYPDLGISRENLMITANHTHSSPGGFGHSVLYDLLTPGYNPDIYVFLVDTLVDAVIDANTNLHEACLSLVEGSFDENIPVAFNRSIDAYNRNPEVREVSVATRHLAVNREMTMLRFDSNDGYPLGSINWFGVHTTSIHNDKHTLSSDNKGHAATLMEAHFSKKGFKNYLSCFAQGSAGDVTPNYRRYGKNPCLKGIVEDDYKARDLNGTFQFKQALSLYSEIPQYGYPDIDYIHAYFDFSKIVIDPIFIRDQTEEAAKSILFPKDKRLSESSTCFAAIGTNFLKGTDEGHGELSTIFVDAISAYALTMGYVHEGHGEKMILINCKDHTFAGSKKVDFLKLLPRELRHVSRFIYKSANNGSWGNQPLIPHILPLQIFIIGNLAIIALPAEPTTVVGKRIQKTLIPILSQRGVTRIVVQGYSNAYSGYITTREEYALQKYEGSHTIFGKWTCAAYQTLLYKMANELLKPRSERKPLSRIVPEKISENELNGRLYETFGGYKSRTSYNRG